MKNIFIYGIILILSISFSSAACTVTETFNDSMNKYSYVDCGTSAYVVQNSPDMSLLLLCLLPLILGGLLLYWATNMTEEHDILRLLIYLSPLPLFWISITWASIIIGTYYGLSELILSMSNMVYVTGILFFVILAYFLLYLLVAALNRIKGDKEEKLRY